ncbi:conjugal transfer protein TraA [Cellulophaga geojensis KL-A]|uniref:Conjugal transfer protein TraA n=1 Tax=Cellulophaga geojensis KL-A TaxID=1328323 RepID=A0ABP3B3J5_9FLAO|nr:ParA family protein [Cellulophaga geojensis]EWH10558.1 conjugal transfer protein TraA [Cellulophaga geojensis KL-A]
MAKIILVTHQKGGVGKSTLTFNLAQNLSSCSKVAILDMDLQGSLLGINHIVNDFIITSDKSILKNSDLDFIFIDTPPYLSDKLSGLMVLSDLIIVPTKAGVLDLLAIESTISIIDDNNKLGKTLIVLNMVKHNTSLTSDILNELKSYKVKIANTQINDLVVFTRSVLLKGVESNHNAQKQMDGLTKEVLKALI